MHTHFTLIVDGVDIKVLVYVFFKKTHPRELVSQLTEHDGEFRLAWIHIRLTQLSNITILFSANISGS